MWGQDDDEERRESRKLAIAIIAFAAGLGGALWIAIILLERVR